MIIIIRYFGRLYLLSSSVIVTVVVFGSRITSLELDVSTVIVNVSLPSTIMSSDTVMPWHTKLPTAVVDGIVRLHLPRG